MTRRNARRDSSRRGSSFAPTPLDTPLDDSVVVNESVNLPLRPKLGQPDLQLTLRINPIESKDAFLVSIDPPTEPVHHRDHVPCDIVLVIDVSGSMAELAPLPNAETQEQREEAGLTVLDLVKHACRTIIATLNEGDRLALVTFSADAKVVASLTEMTQAAKALTLNSIEKLTDEGATNLWAGIKMGLQQFEALPRPGNVQGLYVLTDGMPNYMCPQQGYVPKLRPLLEKLAADYASTPTIHTFGFGYTINSSLMLSIAKAGNGNFSFIPDVAMIGTSFVHAIANLYSTYATQAILKLKHESIGLSHNSGLPVNTVSNSLSIELGSIMYGQSRDLIIACPPEVFRSNSPVRATLTCRPYAGPPTDTELTQYLCQPPSLAPSTLNYHFSRDLLCQFFAQFYPVNQYTQQHTLHPTPATLSRDPTKFEVIVSAISELPDISTDPDLQSLLIDLVGPTLELQRGNLLEVQRAPGSTSGQIHQALNDTPQAGFKSYWERWGIHYLASIWCAHMRQTCNSFKDAGPLRYGLGSPLFLKCKAELDSTFDALDPPQGTWRGHGQTYHTTRSPGGVGKRAVRSQRQRTKVSSMATYNSRDNPCVLGKCTVRLADGSLAKAEDLQVGMGVWSPILRSSREIKEIIKGVEVAGEDICRVGQGLWITPWHPIFIGGGETAEEWVFPSTVADGTRVLSKNEFVYSILLEADPIPDAHAIEVEGITCVTLGHGIMSVGAPEAGTDVRAHPSFGDHGWVSKQLKGLSCDSVGHRLCGGLIRDHKTGLACGVLGADLTVDSDAPRARL